jgi:benzil reductase ((S)-benzoin forming)
MKTIIITGGSKGLGYEIAEVFIKDGWKVVELSRTGTSKYTINIDLANIDKVHIKAEEIFCETILGNPEEVVLVNNACTIVPITKVSAISKDDILNSINVNITAAAIIISQYIKAFRNTRIQKSIVNISSGAAKKGYPGWSLYCIGKAAIENLINSIFEEEKYENEPFRVFNFDPYIMNTDMQKVIRESSIDKFPIVDRYVNYSSEGKLIQPNRIARILSKIINDMEQINNRYDAKEYLDKGM